jgi:hypothetical protein
VRNRYWKDHKFPKILPFEDEGLVLGADNFVPKLVAELVLSTAVELAAEFVRSTADLIA